MPWAARPTRSPGHDEHGRTKRPESMKEWRCARRGTRKDAAKRPIAHGLHGPWRRLPPVTGVSEGSRHPPVLCEGCGRQERPGAQQGLDARQRWKRWSGGESTDEREVPMHPYLACQMSDFGFRKPLRGSNSRVRAEISTSPVCLLENHIA